MQGSWTDRWVTERPEEVDEWVQRLEEIPLTMDGWTGKVGESDERQLQVAKAAGGTSLMFTDSGGENVVSVFIVCGRGRYVANHTPDKCYVAAGYNMGQSPQQYGIEVDEYVDAGKASPEFYTARFSKESPDHSEHLRIFWAWNNGEGWQAPGDAGTAYATAPVLYKMYVISQMRDGREAIEDSEARRFVEEVIPMLDAALFSENLTAEATRPADNTESGEAESDDTASDDDTTANG